MNKKSCNKQNAAHSKYMRLIEKGSIPAATKVEI